MLEDIEGMLISLTTSFAGLGGAMSGLSSPISSLKGGLADTASSLSALGPEGAAAGAGLEVLGAAAAATVGVLGGLMVESIAVNEQLDLLKARTAALAGSAQGGAAVQAMVERLSSKLPFATAQIQEWANQLVAAGVKGKDLEMATKAIAAAAALNPSGGAEAATKMIEKLSGGGAEAAKMLKSIQTGGGAAMKTLRSMGVSMKDLGGQAAVSKMSAEQLNKAIQAALIKKGAGPLDEMNNSFGNLIEKAGEGFRSLFTGLGPAIKPFMSAVKGLFAQFSKGGGAISALKPIVTSVLSTLFGWATRAVHAISGVVGAFVKSGGAARVFHAVVGALHGAWGVLVGAFGMAKPILAAVWAYIQVGVAVLIAIFHAAKPVVMSLWTQIKAGVGQVVTAFQPAIAAFKKLFATLGLGKSSGSALVGYFRIMGTVLGFVVQGVVLLATTFAQGLTSMVNMATMLVTGIQGLPAAISSMVDGAVSAITGLPAAAADAAGNFISGLVGGISAGAGAVVAAVQSLASGALSAFTGALGIHSPSTVMLEHGEDNIAGAAATGIDRGAGAVAKASSKMADGAKPKGRGAGRGGGSGGSITFTGCTFWGTTEDKIRQLLEMVLEEDAGEAGAMGEAS